MQDGRRARTWSPIPLDGPSASIQKCLVLLHGYYTHSHTIFFFTFHLKSLYLSFLLVCPSIYLSSYPFLFVLVSIFSPLLHQFLHISSLSISLLQFDTWCQLFVHVMRSLYWIHVQQLILDLLIYWIWCQLFICNAFFYYLNITINIGYKFIMDNVSIVKSEAFL